MKSNSMFLLTLSLVGISAGISGCGGGGTDGVPATLSNDPLPTGGIGRTGVAMGPITTFGSIVLNGVRYDTSDATFTIDDSPGMESDLRVGQVVTVVGTIDNSLSSGNAVSVTFDENVKGPVQSIDAVAGELVVLGQTIRVTADTSFDDGIVPASLDGLAVGDVVEISGLVRADGSISATRIERAPAGTRFEVRGVVSDLDSANSRFAINDLVVDYSAATLDNFPSGQVSNGDFVDAEGSSLGANDELLASKLEFEDPAFPGEEGDRGEIEGYITRIGAADDFDVAGSPVTTTASTVYEDGSASDLALNVKVEVEGDLNANGVLVADKVEFKRASTVRITGSVDSVDTANDTLVMLGISIKVDALTRFEDKSNRDADPLMLGDINAGDYLEVRGSETPAGSETVLATLLERDDADNETELQGFVQAVSEPTLSILGVTVTTRASTEFKDQNEVSISSAQFFAAVTAGSLVSVKGTETGDNEISADEVEFERED